MQQELVLDFKMFKEFLDKREEDTKCINRFEDIFMPRLVFNTDILDFKKTSALKS